MKVSKPAHLIAAALLIACLTAGPALAASADPLEKLPCKAALLMDARTGDVLYEKNSRAPLPPASMVKMMALLLMMEKVAGGEMTFEDPVRVSARASRMGGSQVYLKHKESFPVRELLKAVAIHSANDASVALAEYTAGSVEAFVDLMNMRADELGMEETTFHSVHGLPPGRGQGMDKCSSRDLALLARELVRHPVVLEWSSTKTAPFRDGEFTLYNTNPLIGKSPGLDGLKTGYISKAGYCLTATAQRSGRRMISVVMGAPTSKDREIAITRLLTRGFAMYKTLRLTEEGQPLDHGLSVKGGKSSEISVAYGSPLEVEVRKDKASEVVLEEELPSFKEAPIQAGETVGRAVARLGELVLGEAPIVALESVEEASFFERLFQ